MYQWRNYHFLKWVVIAINQSIIFPYRSEYKLKFRNMLVQKLNSMKLTVTWTVCVYYVWIIDFMEIRWRKNYCPSWPCFIILCMVYGVYLFFQWNFNHLREYKYTVRPQHSINGNYQFPIHLNSNIVQRQSKICMLELNSTNYTRKKTYMDFATIRDTYKKIAPNSHSKSINCCN